MTNPDFTVIQFIADRTGSMGMPADPPVTKAERTTEGIRSMVTEQRKLPGRTEFALTDFDSGGMTKIPLGNGDAILKWVCRPRNSTPLLDAIGTGIVDLGEVLNAMPEDQRPGRVIFVIATDGEENCSREYTRQQVGDMIKTQKDQFAWDFVFIGADFDAFAEAGGVGITVASTMSTPGVAMAAAYSSTNDAMTRGRQFNFPVGYNLADRKNVAAAAAAAGASTAGIIPGEDKDDE